MENSGAGKELIVRIKEIDEEKLICSVMDGVGAIEMTVVTDHHHHHHLYVGKLITAVVEKTETGEVMKIAGKYSRDLFPIVERYESDEGEQEDDEGGEQEEEDVVPHCGVLYPVPDPDEEEKEIDEEQEEFEEEDFEEDEEEEEEIDEENQEQEEFEEEEEEEEEEEKKKKPGPQPGVAPPGFSINYDRSGRISTVFIRLRDQTTISRRSLKKANEWCHENPNYLDLV